MEMGQQKGLLRRFLQLDAADKRLLLGAAGWLAVARVWLLVLPFRELADRLGTRAASVEADPEWLDRIGRAVGAAAAHVPWRSDCFPQSIAAHQLLKRRGYASTIHLGVERVGEGELRGHAWVTCGPVVVTGGGDMARYAEIHRFGGH
jgi:hypothetical protein